MIGFLLTAAVGFRQERVTGPRHGGFRCLRGLSSAVGAFLRGFSLRSMANPANLSFTRIHGMSAEALWLSVARAVGPLGLGGAGWNQAFVEAI